MPRTPTAIFIVISSRGSWWVDFEGKAHGPYATREDAAIEAGDLAKFSAHAGRRSQVHIPDDDGRYRVTWQSVADDLAALPSRPDVVQLARKLAPNRMGSPGRPSSSPRVPGMPGQVAVPRGRPAGRSI